MEVTRSEFYSILNSWELTPSYQKVFRAFEEALAEKGAKDFKYYRDTDGSKKYHLQMRCTLNGHQFALGKYQQAALPKGTKDYDLFVDNQKLNNVQTPDDVLAVLEVQGIVQSHHRSIRSSYYMEDELVEYLATHGTSQGESNEDFCPLQLAIGALVETEHTDNFDAAVEIAKDHLAEDSCYYGEPKFKDEAIERIESVEPEAYEETEVLAASKGWRERFTKACQQALVKSNRSYLRVGPLSIWSSESGEMKTGDDLVDAQASLPFEVEGKKVYLSGESGELKVLTYDGPISVSPEDSSLPVEYIIEQYLGVDSGEVKALPAEYPGIASSEAPSRTRTFVVPVRVPQQISSLSMKQTEDYFKTGLLTKKEVIAILTKENDWSESEANQIADFWERCYNSTALVKVSYSESEGFTPQRNIYSSAVADILSSLDTLNPKQAILSYASEAWDMEPIQSADKRTDRGLLFTAYDYYMKAEVVPSYKDFVGYLRYTGEFTDYKQAFVDWKALCKKLDPLEDD